jgi:hypothetical protein
MWYVWQINVYMINTLKVLTFAMSNVITDLCLIFTLSNVITDLCLTFTFRNVITDLYIWKVPISNIFLKYICKGSQDIA